MRLPRFEYVEPRTLHAAVRAIASDPKGTVALAGGTDLLVHMKHRLIQPGRVVNLKAIPRLAYIVQGTGGARIGPLTTLHDLAASPALREKYPALARAALEVGAYAHQVMGTLAGNLCQGNRCRFYNQTAFWRSSRPPCYKVGGAICHVVPAHPGDGRTSGVCHSTYCGDLAPVLMALDAHAKLLGADGERSIPLKKLYTQNGKNPLRLRKGELVKEILLPPPAGKTVYLKWRYRGSLEFPIVSLALSMERGKDGRITGSKVVFSGIGTGPVEAVEAEREMKGESVDEGLTEKVSARAVREISPVRTSIISPAHKRKMAGILLKQALQQLM
jgi:4-hydroxybenzoyl-CoA reductase subunit beta